MKNTPFIDYTNKDYQSLRKAMLDLARYRLPEWTDRTTGDLGVLMVDLFAYMGDVILYYQDRIANESFLNTALERRSLVNHLRLIGYELQQPVSASADLNLIFKVPSSGSTLVTIFANSAFKSTYPKEAPQSFEYKGPDLTIDLSSDQVKPAGPGLVVYSGFQVWQSKAMNTEVLGSSSGEPNQSFELSGIPVIPDTVELQVNEGSGWIRWNLRDSLLYDVSHEGRVEVSDPDARNYYLRFNENGKAFVIFGDGVYGRRPPAGTGNIRVTYSTGGGTIGNVPPGTITEAVTAIPNLFRVTNPEAAAGGKDSETDEHARKFGPLAFRSSFRAVTISDYMALAQKAGGVAKAYARSLNWNEIELYVAPEGKVCGKVPEGLRQKLTSYFEDKRMAGTFVRILDPKYVAVHIGLNIISDPHHQKDLVRQTAMDAVMNLLSFENVDFGRSLYQSDVYLALDPLPGVISASITKFQRVDGDAMDVSVEEQLEKYNLPPLEELPEFLKRAVQAEVDNKVKIELEPFEIPKPGMIEIKVNAADR